jgi:hypothetical protein
MYVCSNVCSNVGKRSIRIIVGLLSRNINACMYMHAYYRSNPLKIDSMQLFFAAARSINLKLTFCFEFPFDSSYVCAFFSSLLSELLHFECSLT